MSRQQKKTSEHSMIIEDSQNPSNSYNNDTALPTRKSTRHQQAYSSTLSSASCIFCCKDKYDSSTRKKITVDTMDIKRIESELHEVEKTMIEFSDLHIKKKTIHIAAAERIQLMLGTSGSLFASNVGFHKCCYKSFTSGHFRISPQTPTLPKTSPVLIEDLINEFISVVEYLVVRKK